MKVQITSRKLIKPCKPTPSRLRSFKISYLDQIAHPVNLPVTLCYTCGMVKERFDRLEESLSEILPLFYPLAGRYIKEDHMVDCNDQGAEYVEAQVDCNLLELININDPDLTDLLPCDVCEVDQITHPLLAIQVNKFKCGGVAICVSISHRIFDAASIETFIAALTIANRGGQERENMAISPSFNGPLFFPSKNTSASEKGHTDRNIVVRRFLFDKMAISSLRAKAMVVTDESAATKRPPSTSRLVSAVIMKALARVHHKRYKMSKPLLIGQAVSIRERNIPLLTKHSCGNLVVPSITLTTTHECQNMEYQAFIRFLGDSIIKALASYTQSLSDPEKDCHALIEDVWKSATGAKVLSFSDWTKFNFYDTDFGWGKPIWVGVPNMLTKDFVLLMDNKVRDVIEAWVHLDAQDMLYFQEDEQIKLLTTY